MERVGVTEMSDGRSRVSVISVRVRVCAWLPHFSVFVMVLG